MLLNSEEREASCADVLQFFATKDTESISNWASEEVVGKLLSMLASPNRHIRASANKAIASVCAADDPAVVDRVISGKGLPALLQVLKSPSSSNGDK